VTITKGAVRIAEQGCFWVGVTYEGNSEQVLDAVIAWLDGHL
jgi:hypothetical protein